MLASILTVTLYKIMLKIKQKELPNKTLDRMIILSNFVTMIKWFVGNRPLVLVLLPFVVGILVLINHLDDYYISDLPINFGLWGHQIILSKGIIYTIAPILMLINAIRLSQLFNRNSFTDHNTYISSLLFVLLLALLPSSMISNYMVLAQVFLVLALFQLFHLFQNEDGRKRVFNAGIFFGIAATYDNSLLTFLPFFWFSVLVIRPFKIRELSLLLAGFILPFIYSIAASKLMGTNLTFGFFTGLQNNSISNLNQLITLSIIILAALIAIYSMITHSQKTSIRTKKLLRILMIWVLYFLIIGFVFFIKTGDLFGFGYLMIPISLLLSLGFILKETRRISRLFAYIVMVFLVVKIFL